MANEDTDHKIEDDSSAALSKRFCSAPKNGLEDLVATVIQQKEHTQPSSEYFGWVFWSAPVLLIYICNSIHAIPRILFH